MGLPIFPNMTPNISLGTEQIVPLLLGSIALEELGLAHMINSEAEAIQNFLGTLDGGIAVSPPFITLSNFLDLNSSIETNFRGIIMKEMLLEFKFRNVLKLLGSTPTPIPPCDLSFTSFGGPGQMCTGGQSGLSGDVVDCNGDPVRGANVFFTFSDSSKAFANPTTTDASGHFTSTIQSIDGPAINLQITAHILGSTTTATASTNIIPCTSSACAIINTSPILTVCAGGGTVAVEGTVVDCFGDNIPNATVNFIQGNTSNGILTTLTTTTDTNGHFSVNYIGLIPGPNSVTATVQGTSVTTNYIITTIVCP